MTLRDKTTIEQAQKTLRAVRALQKRYPTSDGTVDFCCSELQAWLKWLKQQHDSTPANVLPGQLTLFGETS